MIVCIIGLHGFETRDTLRWNEREKKEREMKNECMQIDPGRLFLKK